MQVRVQWIFPPYRLDRIKQQLWRGLEEVPLAHASRNLAVFGRAAWTAVSEEALLEEVWGGLFGQR